MITRSSVGANTVDKPARLDSYFQTRRSVLQKERYRRASRKPLLSVRSTECLQLSLRQPHPREAKHVIDDRVEYARMIVNHSTWLARRFEGKILYVIPNCISTSRIIASPPSTTLNNLCLVARADSRCASL